MKKTAYVSPECVGCGYCAKICPRRAISVPKGIRAVIDDTRCVGCGKCAGGCPAEVITIIERGKVNAQAKAVV